MYDLIAQLPLTFVSHQRWSPIQQSPSGIVYCLNKNGSTKMSTTTLHIRNMVCNRCIRAVEEELTALGYTVDNIELGEVKLKERVDEEGMGKIRDVLRENGFELIDDRKSRLINRIKTLIIEYIHHDREKPGHMNLSRFLSLEVDYDYSYLSNLFSSVEGITIEKEYDRSVQHLSRQFKKVTGLTPSHFRQIRDKKRKPLDQV